MNDSIWTQESSLKHRGGFPLRTPDEVAKIMFDFAESSHANKSKNIITLLGVTPEITMLPWAKNTKLLAFDKSAEAIKSVWTPNKSITSIAQKADWLSLPLENHSTDFILGDGCTTQINNMDAYKPFFSELKRILTEDGLLIMRIFVRPESSEPLEKIITDLLNKKIEYFGSLKWRIAMSLAAENKKSEIEVAQIYEAFQTKIPDRSKLANLCDWPLDIINTIDVYKNSNQSYTFPTLLEFKKSVEEYFQIDEIKYGSYELSERCPILSMKVNR